MGYPSREEAWALLTEFTSNESLLRHALAVEASMRAYARKFGEDEDEWGVTGLLHDFDYEKYPDPKDHPFRGAEILRERGYPEEMIQAILGHSNHTGVPRESRMAKALFAVDELTGFITAIALVRPSKKVADVKPKSVKKKMKETAFARAIDRDAIRQGMEELGVEFNEHVSLVIDAMASIADQLGLDGRLAEETKHS